MRNTYLQMCDYGSRFRILKGGKISLVVSAFIASTTLLHAAPSGGVVTSGTASIVQSGSVTNITQATQKAAINWQNFSIGASETVNFNQPNINAVTLNRVVGNEKSIIDGALNANGQVFILNSNGLLFSKNASINTAGLVATTMNLSDADFMSGNYNFKGESTASVINQGTINISDKGYAALFGKEVINEGIIKATLGAVHVTGASEVTLNLNGNSLVNLTVNKGVLDALVENKGAIYADGGEVYLTTNAVNELLKGVVNNTGIVEANSLDDITGKVILFAHGGEAQVGGSIKSEGGFVETSGKEFTIKEGATIKAKEWLIDPVNITIDNTLAGTISTALGSGDVTITTDGACTGVTCSGTGSDGDITVASDITWASDNDLTLSAYRNIIINKNITATGAGGKVSLYYGQGAVAASNTATYSFGLTDTLNATTGSNFTGQINLQAGQNFSTKLGNNGAVVDYTVITDLGTSASSNDGTLQGMRGALTGKFVLGANIDASGTSTWNTNAGFTPIGPNFTSKFTGHFDGLGHAISGLTINRPTADTQGLFGYTDSALIQNVGLIGGSLTAKRDSGPLVGYLYNNSKVFNAYATSSVSGEGGIGGLIGGAQSNNNLIISNSYATGNVAGNSTNVGGFIGYIVSAKLTNSYATGNVVGNGDTGGFIGLVNNAAAEISNSYATGSVNFVGSSEIQGGFVGTNKGLIFNSYATGSVTGVGQVGGFVGWNNTGTIYNSYATGAVTSDRTWKNYYGGFVGKNTYLIYSSYATGNVNGTNNVGGFAGTNEAGGVINDSYATGNLTTFDTGTGGTQTAHTIGGFVGSITGGTVARSYSTGLVPTSSGDDSYGGFAGTIDVASSTRTNNFWDTTTSGKAFADSSNAAIAGVIGKTTTEMKTSSTYSSWPSIVGTDAVYPTLTFGTGANAAKVWQMAFPTIAVVYTLSTIATGYTYNGTSQMPTDWTPTFLFSGNYNSWVLGTDYTFKYGGSDVTGFTNAGTYSGISVSILKSGYSLASSGNTDGSFTIDKAPLSLSGFTASDKVYDATTTASVSGTLGAAFGSDTVTLTGTFADKNAGTSKTVTAGVSNANYTIAPTTTTANITAKVLAAITGITASNKIYDGLTSATIDFASAGFTGKEDGDTLSISSATGTFGDKHVGTGKTVTISGITLGGADAGNYSIVGLTPTTTADITTKAVTLNAPDVTREYNGNATYTASAGDLSTLSALLGVAGDSISAITLAFDTKDVGTDNKTLTPSSATISDGNSGNNYAITYADNTTSTISPKSLSLSGAVADNKVYDGLTSATMSNYGTITGVIGSEVVTIDTSAATSAFADKNVGTGKTVTISGVTLGGADAGNYTAGSSLTTTANITRLASVTWVGGATGDWSNPANWAGGAIPDFSNVADVVIPTGTTVAFDAGLSAPVYVDNISSLGGLEVATGTLNVSNLLSTATYNQTGGAVVGHDMTVTTSYAQPSGTITMSGDVSITQTVGNVAIGELASDTLHVTTTNGAITQVGGSKITSTTSSTFVAGGDNDITLTNDDNEFGVLSMSGNDVAAKDKDALPLGNIIATGTVGVTTTNGDITQSAGSKIEAGGTTTVVAGNNKDITLNNDNNDFTNIAATGKNITIKDKNELELDNIIATGTVSITTTNGDITQTSGKKIEAGGDTTITAGNNKDVTLEEDDNDFTKITVAGNDVSVKDKNDLEVGGLTATGTAKVETKTGNITQTTGSTVSVGGSTTLIAGGSGTGDGTVTLGSTTNTFGGPVNITASAATIGATTTPTFGTLTGLTAPTVQTPPPVVVAPPVVTPPIVTPPVVVVPPVVTPPVVIPPIVTPPVIVPPVVTPPTINENIAQQVVDSIIQSVARPPVISGSTNLSFTSSLGTPSPLIVSTGTPPVFTAGGSNQGSGSLSFVSQPTQGESTQRITLSELRTLQQPSQQEGQSETTPVVGEIRIALAQNSLIGLINGGVRLPEGVDQEFYVVEDRRAQR